MNEMNTSNLREWTTDRIKSLQERSEAIGLTDAETEELETLDAIVNKGEQRFREIPNESAYSL